jgi:DNA polymerase III subunit alpha
MAANFVHLHLHSEYSILDGACRVSEILQRCEDFGMRSCALTDHGALFGAVEFYQAALKRGIKPIIGCELYVARESRFTRGGRSGNYNHFLVLCENEEGYHNLCRLSTLGYLEGFHYKPRVDDDLLAKYSAGIIATSACLAGAIPQALMNDDWDTANALIEKYVAIYGKENFLIELMDHGLPDQQKTNPMLAELAEHHGLMLIATNDCHYINKSDAEAHEALLCVQTNATLEDPNHFKFPTNEFYFSSPDEMRQKFDKWPEAVTNTEKVANRCNVELPLNKHLIPQYEPPPEFTQEEYLRKLVALGMEERFGAQPPKEYLERADYEVDVIIQMGFVDYFLVVWDLINFARSKSIPVGPGRGSGAGSIVAYALKITNIDPMRYNLLFERFLNPERVSMPDFDIDFCYVRREEMIEYTRQKYGPDNVSQIITFGRMLAKQVVRNVGRVMGMPYGEVDRIAKLIPDELKITLKDAYDKEPELKQLVDTNPQIAKLWEYATRLEGTIGNCGTHAAGVVICDQPLTDHVALYRAPGTETVATQTEMKCLEEIGLLKMDFLGLRTLTVVHEAVRFIKQNRGIPIDIDHLEPDDAKTYQALRSGQTTGIFQLESSGMRDVARRIGLESLEEVCALVALYRPGPMQFIDTYIDNKHHPEKVQYEHPLLEKILAETYGIAVYQEQVMQIVQAIGGFSLGQADIVRRAMGKKKADLLDQQRAKFIEGAKANAIDKDMAQRLWEKIQTFAGYGFNKSHSMAYAFVAYQTAFLKANYPVEFMAALLTSESGNLDKVGIYTEECRRMGIKVLPPDINHSFLAFAVEGDSIRFGLGAIKNVGGTPAEAIVLERTEHGAFKDIFDFCGRMSGRQVNRRLIESLNKAGAFASTGWNRRQIESVLEAALSEGQISQRERDSGQSSLFDLMEGDEAEHMHQKPELDEWPEHELLAFEKEMLGLYVTSHPLAKHAGLLTRYTNLRIEHLHELKDGVEVVIGGLVGAVKNYTTSKGKRMAFVTLDTLEGACEVTVFSDTYEQCAGLLVQDNVVVIPARVSYRNSEAGLLANDVIAIRDVEARLTKAVHIRLNTGGLDRQRLDRLAQILGDRPGPCDVYIHCITPAHEEVTIHATSACKVAASDKLKIEIAEILGEDALWCSGGNGLPMHH